MQDGFNALMWAAYVGNAGTLTALLDNGANLKTRNNVRNWTGELSDRINLSKFLSPMLLQPLCSSPSHLWYLHFLWICSFSLSHSIPLFLIFYISSHSNTLYFFFDSNHFICDVYQMLISLSYHSWLQIFLFLSLCSPPLFFLFLSCLLLLLIFFISFFSSLVFPINSYYFSVFLFFISNLLFFILSLFSSMYFIFRMERRPLTWQKLKTVKQFYEK